MFKIPALIMILALSLFPVNGWGQLPDKIPVNKPECGVWDSLYNRYLISRNIIGDIVQVDSNGTMTLFKDNGRYTNSAAIDGTTIYQSFMNSVAGYDLATAAEVFYVSIAGSVYLGGVAADTSGNIYVTDIGTWNSSSTEDKIWKIRLSDNTVSKFADTEHGLGFVPRDLVFDAEENRLIVTFAGVFQSDPVYIQAVSVQDSVVTDLVKFETEYSNGIARDQFGNIYVAGYDNKTVYRYDPDFISPPEVVSVGHDGPCNIDYNQQDHIIVVPDYFGDTVHFVRMGRPELLSQTLLDVTGGDGDGIAEDGETIDLIVTLSNTHLLPLTDISVTLVQVSDGLTITRGSVELGSVLARSSVNNSDNLLSFFVQPGFGNKRGSFHLELTYTSDYGTEIDTVIFEKPIGYVSIMLIDDEKYYNIDQYYNGTLATLDFAYDVWNTVAGPPPDTLLSKFDVVVWFVGEKQPEPLNADEREVIKNYLNAGGNLFLTGQGIASYLDTVDQDFLQNYLRAAYVKKDIYAFLTYSGAVGSALFETTEQVKASGIGGASNQTVYDIISPTNGGIAALMHSDQTDIRGVTYEGTYRTVFLSFGFEAIANGVEGYVDRELVLSRILNYFNWINPCCEGATRGNANNDPQDVTNIADVTYLVNYLFGIPLGPEPECRFEGNANGDLDEKVNIADISYLVAYLFGIPTGPPPTTCP